MNSEEDEFNRIEREALLRKAAVQATVGKHTIDMAREAGIGLEDEDHYQVINLAELEAFEALVRADERKSWPDEMEAMERQVNILTDALAQEREACAKVCEVNHHTVRHNMSSFECAAAIRARSNT